MVKTTTFQQFKTAFPTNSLENWCNKGVLLLNSSLTVRAGEVGSHSYLQWNKFIQEVFRKLQTETTPKVFIALGKEAQLNLTASMIENTQHCYIMAGHPASGAHGKDTFSGSNIFSKTNHFFYKNGLQEINWTLI